MERRDSQGISLPSMKNLLEHTHFNPAIGETPQFGGREGPCHDDHRLLPPLTPTPTRLGNTPLTPKQSHLSTAQLYPSPASDGRPEDQHSPRSSVRKTSLFSRQEERVPAAEQGSPEAPKSPVAKTNLLTPTIVHYVPEGMPSARSRRRASTSQGQKRRQSSSGSPPPEPKKRMVKWDRTSNKGTAPLNVAPRTNGPRSCALCHVIKKRVPPPLPLFLLKPRVNVSVRST